MHYSGVSSTSINFANTSGGNMQILSSWGLMLVNIISIGVYAYSIATGGASSGNSGSGTGNGPKPGNKELTALGSRFVGKGGKR